jgi:hypothetical protein
MKRLGPFALVPVVLTGCFLGDFRTVARPQTEDPDPAQANARTVGDVCTDFDNAAHVVVCGYGLVTGLDGTGGTCPPCDARTAVIERLKRAKEESPSEIVDSPSNAVVIVSAVVRPGIRRDELVDVEVTLPQGSRVKSLRGGILLPTPLMTFATQEEVRGYLKQNDYGTATEGNRLLRGHEVVVAKGPLQSALAGPADADAETEKPLTRAFVWKGGRLVEGRAMFLVLKTDHQKFRIAEQVAARINETFHAGESAGSKVAVARHKDLVAVAVPPRYRLNRPHFMRVVWAVPLNPPAEQDDYVKQLEEQLQQPETALIAAVRLEAVGMPAAPVLKRALTSEYPLVRFAAAEALAYLGQPGGAEVLQRCAAEHPALQAYALTALAALDDALGITRLEELLAAKEPEVRYGAFRALREIDPSGDPVRGTWAKKSYVIHEVNVTGPPLVHILREGRAEFVLFGEPPQLVPPFSLTAGPEMTVTARPGDTVVTISRFSARTGNQPTHVQSSLAVADVLRKMAELGAAYTDAAEMLTKAHERKALGCRLAVDALPKAVAVKRLAEAAREDPRMQQEFDLLAETESAEAGSLFWTQKNDGRKE